MTKTEVAESGCQEEPDIQESEQIKKNTVKQQKICPPTRKDEIVIEQLEQCSKVYDFYGDPETYFLECQMKEMMLNQLSSYITDKRTIISECLYPEIVSMCAAHMFRELSPSSNPPAAEFLSQSEEPKLDPAWPQIQLVYEFFQTFLEAPSFQVEIAEKYIGKEFVTQLLQQFVSEDPREREWLQVTVKSIYSIFPGLQGFILCGFCDICYRFVDEKWQPTGIAETPGSHGRDVAPPLTEEDLVFFWRVLVPLHKPNTLHLYHEQLVRCIVQFLVKEATLTGPLVLYLLKHWPKTCTCKELLFIKELEEILQYIYTSECKLVQEPLFKQLARCISGSNHVVAKAALQFCIKKHITHFISDNAEEILPIVLPALYQCSNSQLYESVKHILTDYLPQLLMMNPELFA
ncbi:serine/threonine-protein phosphatase 2A 56 kDa regulatory subunit gamma isoform-like, partial [Thalassophryne amazonica]|uniref:serine/threonine-protein phosphatase 2A 56 kDa regulatory subunit gamma isoform-like n=1 Tax=Thalassophryne amazonica TaxID=390379 RepID=UPI001471A2D8